MRLLLLLSLLAGCAAYALAQRSAGFPVRATTDKGVIEGVYDVRTGLRQFRGVPFA